MRLAVPYKVVGGTRFYDRREVKDAMAYLRAVVNPADEVSVKRVLNVPKRGIGDASIAKLDALAAGEGIGFVDALRRAVDAGVTGPAVRGIDSFVTLLDELGAMVVAGDDSGETAGPGDLLQAALERSGYLAELEAEDTVESAGRLENLGELVGSAREFTQLDEFLEQVAARRRHRRAARRRGRGPGRPDDAALGEGPGVPRRVPHRRRGGRLPAQPGPHRARRAGGGAPPGLRRHHPGPRAPVRHPRLEPQPVRLDAVQPAVAVPRGDPGRARRRPGQHHRARAPTAARACARGRTGARRRRTVGARRRPRTRRRGPDRRPPGAGRRRRPGGRRGATRRCRAMPTTSVCASATTSSTRRSGRA